MPPELNAIISERLDLGPELSMLRIVPNFDIPDFKPGQFTVLGLPGSSPRGGFSTPDRTHPDPDKFIQRAYSIASTPLNKHYIEFYITLVREGALTPRLWCLRMGDRLWLSPKITGSFTMDNTPEDKNIIFVSTGTGVAPFVSMLQSHMKFGLKRKFALIHGVRQSQDLGYRGQLNSYTRLFPENFNYYPIISREKLDPVPWKGPIGRVQNIFENGDIERDWGFKITPDNTHVYLCGNPAMIRYIIELLAADGFKEHTKTTPGQIHAEKYW